jgi:hypothetical protein
VGLNLTAFFSVVDQLHISDAETLIRNSCANVHEKLWLAWVNIIANCYEPM